MCGIHAIVRMLQTFHGNRVHPVNTGYAIANLIDLANITPDLQYFPILIKYPIWITKNVSVMFLNLTFEIF